MEFADEDIDISENEDEYSIYNKKISFIKNYVKIAMIDGKFIGDSAITTAFTLSNCIIKMYILIETWHKLYYSLHKEIIKKYSYY